MAELSNFSLTIILFCLITATSFFSLSETSMLSLNRYRLRHLAKGQNRSAKRVLSLLDAPDKLLGLILIGNTFANILAGAIFTILALRLWGEQSVALATLGLTLLILVLGEIAPKTVAVIYPLNIALAISWPIRILLWLFYPLVWFINKLTNGLLRCLGVKLKKNADTVTHDELRSILHEASGVLPSVHKNMLLSLLDLEKLTVDDIMVPKAEIEGIDLDWSMEKILQSIIQSEHLFLPVYQEDVDNIKGILNLRDIISRMSDKVLTKENILQVAKSPYFIPAGTPLNAQLLHFRHENRRCGLVVDEYGEIEGWISVEDILEEVLGEFSSPQVVSSLLNERQSDGSYLVDARIAIRELNRKNHWSLPVNGPKTLNGLILEYLEQMPTPGLSMKIEGYVIEVLAVSENKVKRVRILP